MNKAKNVRHGEVILQVVSSLPDGENLEKSAKKYIVAHSETGHHHVLEAVKPFKVWTWNGETYLEVPEMAELWHQKTGKDAHAPHKIVPAFYKVVIKKSYDYFEKTMTRVRD